MIRMEFDNINEYDEFIDWCNKKDTEKCISQEQSINEHYLAKTNIKKEIEILWDGLFALENHFKKWSSLEEKVDEIYNILNPPKISAEKTGNKIIGESGRFYNQTAKDRFPQLVKICEDGHFLTNRNKKTKFSINDVFKLKKCLSTNLTWKEMGEKVDLSDFSVQYICYGIDFGLFEKFINDWEQMEANRFKNKIKPATIINNPEKRKENMVG